MTDIGDSRVPDKGAVISIHDQLLRWLRDHALPLWDRWGVDRGSGGYFETLEFERTARQFEAVGSVRRGRVVARQIFVFDVGRRLGWCSVFSSPIDHGCDYLFSRLHAGKGLFHTALDAATQQPCAPFSLYEQAFYLLALARLAAASADRSATTSTHRFPIMATALHCLQQLRSHWGRAEGGFEESNPPSVPLKSNPHMHLLEAALAWIEVSPESSRQPWVALAGDIVRLCLTYFVDANTGAVREYFDDRWQPAAGDAGRIVEPGHQFEWAWLLMEWSSSSHVDLAERQACRGAVRRLMQVGECGVDPVRGVAINESWDDMRVKDAAAKLWPQTERLKAWCAVFDRASSASEAQRAAHKMAAAAHSVCAYLLEEPSGLWHEVRLPDGTLTTGPSKASSFYHIVCAIDVLRRTVSAHRANPGLL